MTHFNWYIDRVADYHTRIPPKWDLNSAHNCRNRFVEDGSWGLIGPWDMNIDGTLQNGEHRWVHYNDYDPTINGIIPLIMHMSWEPSSIELMIEYLEDPIRNKVLHNANTQLLIHYAVEGFADEVFHSLNKLPKRLNIPANKILYCSGSLNIQDLYDTWANDRGIPEDERFRVCVDIPWLRVTLHAKEFISLKEKKLPIAISQWPIYKRARYVCLNRRLHSHRMFLVAQLKHFDLLKYGKVSLPKILVDESGTGANIPRDFLEEWQVHLKEYGHHPNYDEIYKSATELYNNDLPLSADGLNLNVNLCHDFNSDLSDLPISIVTETHFFNKFAFASEKIWKPISYGQVFIPIASKDYLKGLRTLGFKTFEDHIFDVTGIEYDTIDDHLERMDNVVSIVKTLCNLSDDDFIIFLEKCEEDVIINRDRMFDYNYIRQLLKVPLKTALEKFYAKP